MPWRALPTEQSGDLDNLLINVLFLLPDSTAPITFRHLFCPTSALCSGLLLIVGTKPLLTEKKTRTVHSLLITYVVYALHQQTS